VLTHRAIGMPALLPQSPLAPLAAEAGSRVDPARELKRFADPPRATLPRCRGSPGRASSGQGAPRSPAECVGGNHWLRLQRLLHPGRSLSTANRAGRSPP
jgi:hypothetical protein